MASSRHLGLASRLILRGPMSRRRALPLNALAFRPIASTSKASLSTLPHDLSVAPPPSSASTAAPSTASAAPPNILDLSDPTAAHGSKSTLELVRSMAVFHACQYKFLVRHAESLLSLSSRILGKTLTNAVVKRTFFRHFCAGEDREDMRPVIKKLEECGVGPILDYAAESDGGEDDKAEGKDEGIFTRPPFNQPARVYDYKSERECDRHVNVFKDCIRSVQDVSPCGFAALKVTALGNPALLERMSDTIDEVKRLFGKFDERGEGVVGRDEFVRCYEHYFHADEDRLAEILRTLDPHDTGAVDYIAFADTLTPCALPAFTRKCRDAGPLALATPSSDEVALMKRAAQRLRALASEARDRGTKLLVDAEHGKFQPAIDALVLELQREFNDVERTERPVVFNTYQCYLKDAPERIATDLRRSERFGFHFAAKLVRGAYMVHERERAKRLNRPSPIHDTVRDTHRCYDDAVDLLLRHRAHHGTGTEVVIATHKEASVARAVRVMDELDLAPDDDGVHFAQLYGMSDNLTFALGRGGYNAFKYLPYGKVDEVVPYLVRRAQENGDVLGNAAKEMGLLREELRKRFFAR